MLNRVREYAQWWLWLPLILIASDIGMWRWR
jgi:hypothetical protein